MQRLSSLQRHGFSHYAGKKVTQDIRSNQGIRNYNSLILWKNQTNKTSSIKSSQSLVINNLITQYPSSLLYRFDQTRHMGRKDGHSAFYKARPTTRKQRKKYYKRKREEDHHKVGKHSKPGSKAGPLREYEELERQDLVDKGAGKISRGLLPENMGYNYGDGMYLFISMVHVLFCSCRVHM